VAAGGAIGGLTRALVAEISASWPWPTLLVNVVGAFVLGVAVVYGRRHWRPAVMAGVTVGLLGALTTFSTLAGELWSQQEAGDWGGLAWYALASIVGGLLAAVAGLRLGRVVQ
jgi:CrcB protein